MTAYKRIVDPSPDRVRGLTKEGLLERFIRGETITAAKLNKAIDQINAAQNATSGVRQLRRPPIAHPAPSFTNTITVFNNTTEDLEAGDVLQVIGASNDGGGRYQILGDAVELPWQERYVVFAAEAVKRQTEGEFFWIGFLLANVDVTDNAHRYAKPEGVKMVSSPYETRFLMLNADTNPGEPIQLLVTAPRSHWSTLYSGGRFKTISAHTALVCTTPDGFETYAIPDPVSNPDSWNGKTFDGVTYTSSAFGFRNATGDAGSWLETLRDGILEGAVSVVPNDDIETADIPYRVATGAGTWTKECV